MKVALHHRTSYRYDRLVTLGPQTVRLRPAPHTRTPIDSYSLKVEPAEHFLNWQQDPFGNFQSRHVFPKPTRTLDIEVDLVVEWVVVNPFDFFLEPSADEWPFVYEPSLRRDLAPFLETQPMGPLFEAWLDKVPRDPVQTIKHLVDLNQRLQQDIAYVVRMEPGVQTPEETLQLARGSCRDSSWLLVHILRRLGIAARFVSGYLIQLTADEKALDGPSGPENDFCDLHAWAEAFLPGAGWVGLDPTSGLLAGEGHIPLAATPEPGSATPVSGGLDACEAEFRWEMSVRRIDDRPRTTKPFSDAQWEAIDALGATVDAALEAGDVRLTMGGEPTFVSIDDPDGEEWNTAAVGPTKRGRGLSLIRRLKERFAPSGVIHDGQGKWYPGESLPRWALSLYWRGDAVPLWRHPERLTGAGETQGAGAAEAAKLCGAIAERLGLDPSCAMPAFEDPWHYLVREGALPANVDPFDSKLEDPEERARLLRVFERGLGEPVGWVLPVQRWQSADTRRWQSEKWKLRRGKLLLTAGDSALGYRLPLASLPWLSKTAYPHVWPVDPTAARGALPVPIVDQPRSSAKEEPVAEASEEILGASVRTALSVEAREGRLHVFLPPVASADDWVELLAAVESAAGDTGMKVQLEGYEPPHDARINVIKVTPDPGVLEVNVHPGANWAELRAITTGLYEDARQSRLGTVKFQHDGREVGTGGGNHLVLGARTPVDSPFLRRPDLLRSIIAYWQNHPSLSYLFSGLFIGPTSQAPRIDEARDDQLYELEIAFAQVPMPNEGRTIPPWLVDRLFRNLLIDVTGNTHRTELCIDKLYSPDHAAGRLGLLELRNFEMPPHARMSLLAQLLLRALVARFWQEPHPGRLVRWGTALHDRFLLPEFCRLDLLEVLEETRRSGFDFDPAWFEPQHEFRFPIAGTFDFGQVHVELRHALEPWHVMGEEGAVGGTVRYVDSSLERMQVKVRGAITDRYLVLCNGRRVPLVGTGEGDVRVGGVRFRAWQPPSCLHPTIAPHTPLVFDLFDTWSNRAVAGATYSPAHPGGRNYDTRPVNANEAEGRVRARFFEGGHTPGWRSAPPQEQNPSFPTTLDLRRPLVAI